MVGLEIADTELRLRRFAALESSRSDGALGALDPNAKALRIPR